MNLRATTARARRGRFLQWLTGRGTPLSLPQLVAWSAVLGLIGGALEAVYLTLRFQFTGRSALWYYPEILWMAPVSTAVVLVLVALLAGSFGRLTRTGLDTGRATFLFTIPSILAVAAAPGIPIHELAAITVAFGIAAGLARIADRRADRIRRAMPRAGLTSVAVLLLLVVVGTLQVPQLRERRALAGLPAAGAGGPNVLLIILDTVRAANLGLYGYGRATTPHLDRWAARGVVFDRAIATAPWTLPSHATMFTGRYNEVVGTGIERPLDGRYPTLAEVLSRNGYATAGFVANLGYTTRASGLDRGFARYEDFPVVPGMFVRSAWLPRQVARLMTPLTGLFGWHVPKSGERVTDEFERWLAARPARPFFVFLNYYDAHGPYEAPPGYRGRFGPVPDEELTADEPHSPGELAASLNAYDDCIAYLDDQLARVFEILDSTGLDRNTLVIVTSDHGEMFGENGQVAHTSGLYMPVLHVPLVMVLPGVLPGGERVGEPVTLRDLPATILDVVDAAEASAIPGQSLVAHIGSGESARESSPLLSELDRYDWAPEWTPIRRGDMESLVDGRLHYIRNGDGEEELYDAVADPAEASDLSNDPSMGGDLDRMRAALDSVLDRLAGARAGH